MSDTAMHLFEDATASPANSPGEGEPAPQGVKATGQDEPGPRLPAVDFGSARMSDPGTSHVAAALPGKGRHRERALLALADAGSNGLTDFELAAKTRVGQTSIGKRRKELQERRLVELTEDERPSPSGAPAKVWRITPAGSAEALHLRSVLSSYSRPPVATGTNAGSGPEIAEGR